MPTNPDSFSGRNSYDYYPTKQAFKASASRKFPIEGDLHIPDKQMVFVSSKKLGDKQNSKGRHTDTPNKKFKYPCRFIIIVCFV